MAKTITLARPMRPNGIGTDSRARSMGDTAEFHRESTDSAGNHLTWVKFPDGEIRVLVDRDIAPETNYSTPSSVQAHDPMDTMAIWCEWDMGGEGGV